MLNAIHEGCLAEADVVARRGPTNGAVNTRHGEVHASAYDQASPSLLHQRSLKSRVQASTFRTQGLMRLL